MSKKKQKYNIWSFIVCIFNFFRGWKKQEEGKQDTLNEELKLEYEEIDKDKEDQKDEDLEGRINNMF